MESFRHCRFFLSVAGTFAKENLNLTILMAASVGAESDAVLVAWAIGEGNRRSHGTTFSAISSLFHRSTTISSDRDKGIDAADGRVPRAHLEHCPVMLEEFWPSLTNRIQFKPPLRFDRGKTAHRL